MIGEQNVYIDISGCRSLLQSPGISFCALGVVENTGFTVGIVILSVLFPRYKYVRFRWPRCHFRLSVVVAVARGQFFELGVVNNPIFAVRCVIFCHSARYVSISGFGGHIAISGCRSLSQSLGDTLFGLAMVENPGLAVGISTLSVVVPVV